MTVKPPPTSTVRASPRLAPTDISSERQDGGGERADADAVEMHPQRRHHHHAAELGEHEGERQRETQEEHNRRQGQSPHSPPIDNSGLDLKGARFPNTPPEPELLDVRDGWGTRARDRDDRASQAVRQGRGARRGRPPRGERDRLRPARAERCREDDGGADPDDAAPARRGLGERRRDRRAPPSGPGSRADRARRPVRGGRRQPDRAPRTSRWSGVSTTSAARQARERARELLDEFELSYAGGRLVRTYSGGMRRRLDLAAAMVARPAVLVPRRADDRHRPAQQDRALGDDRGPGRARRDGAADDAVPRRGRPTRRAARGDRRRPRDRGRDAGRAEGRERRRAARGSARRPVDASMLRAVRLRRSRATDRFEQRAWC